MGRISKKDYYLGIAEAVSKRSPCLKMHVGSIIVKNDSIISSGYNGIARGEPHCIICSRLDKESGSEYITCPAIHSEENAIINAARQGVSTLDSILYLWTDKGGLKPCYRCERAIRNAGIKEVIVNE